ncbi:MAG: beta-galactosidase [Coriobacteriales bacterium]
MRSFDFDKKGFIIDGKRDFLIGGEIAHFRVPKSEWRSRMRLFKKAGGNALTTSVAWLLHEPEEGKILFDDTDYRSLKEYLTIAGEEGLFVYLRPGPLVYTELINGGIPPWLFEKYPQVKACAKDGTAIEQLSYMHPLALEKFKRYYRALAEEIKPFLITAGGPVAMVQLDNELAGIHTWSGTLDYNEETMGFFREDGLYPRFMKERYKSIEKVNEAYGTRFAAFTDIDPRAINLSGRAKARAEKDYHDFYCRHLAVYARQLLSWLREFGIDVPVTANAANAYLLNYLKELSDEMKDEKFFIGFDNYYALDVNWANFHPTPKWYMKTLYAADAMRAMGYPFTVLEMELGSYADIPPVLPEDLHQWYMLNLGLGMKGVSYYIFAGGANPEFSGMTTDVYDFQAPVSSDGKIRKSYQTLKKFNLFMKENEWLLGTERIASVQVGVEWQTMRGNDYAVHAGVPNTTEAEDRLIKCLSFSLFSSKYSHRFVELTGELDTEKPLLVMSPDTMSQRAQQNVADFIERGGRVYILAALPSLDESFAPCTLLRDYLGQIEEVKNPSLNPAVLIGGERVFYVTCPNALARIPDGAEAFATDGDGKYTLGFKMDKGKGKVYYLGGHWRTTDAVQVRALEKVLADLGAEPCVEHSNPSVYATVLSDGTQGALFLINLYTGAQESEVKVHFNGEIKELGHIRLKPSEVKFIRF